MIWTLILLFLLIIIQIIIIGICFSSLILNVKECEISYNVRLKNEFEIIKLKMSVDIYLFKKIRILSIKIHKNYCEIFKTKLRFNLLKKLKSDKDSGISYVVKNIWKLEPKIQSMDLKLDFGTESTMLNVFTVPFLSTLLSGIINNYSKDNIEKTDIRFKIIPQFIDKNVLDLKLSTKIYFNTIKTMFFIRKHQEI